MDTVSQHSSQDTNGVHVIDCGAITTGRWPGGVTASSVSDETITEAISHLNEFYVPVHVKAKTRCIDGRYDPELNENMLGAQVPGGAPGAALAWRLGVDDGVIGTATFLADAEHMMDEFERLGFTPGGHRDAAHIGDEHMVGCGAIDGMDIALKTMVEHLDDHKRLVSLIVGADFDHHIYREMLGATTLINYESARYFAGREKVISILEIRFPGSVSTLTGNHQEAIVVINMVPNTTLASNRFAESSDGVQAFGYDMWRPIEIARSLLPLDNQMQLRQNFITASVMTSVATLMALTDGSQRLVLRTPSGV